MCSLEVNGFLASLVLWDELASEYLMAMHYETGLRFKFIYAHLNLRTAFFFLAVVTSTSLRVSNPYNLATFFFNPIFSSSRFINSPLAFSLSYFYT